MNKYRIIKSPEQFSKHFGVCCVIARSLLKHTDLNITDFLPKILLFPEDCGYSGLSQDPFLLKSKL